MQITPFVLPLASALSPAVPAVPGFAGNLDLVLAGMPMPENAAPAAAMPGKQAPVAMPQRLDMQAASAADALAEAMPGTQQPQQAQQLLAALSVQQGEEEALPAGATEHIRLPVTLRVRRAKAMLADNPAGDAAGAIPAAHILLAAMAGAPAMAAQASAAQAMPQMRPAVALSIGGVAQPIAQKPDAKGAAVGVMEGKGDAAVGKGAGADAFAMLHGVPATEGAGDRAASGQGQHGQGQRHEAAPAFPAVAAPESAVVRHADPAAAPHTATIAARAGHFGEALGVEIARRVDLGNESFRVRLNPAELGHVEVTLAFDDGGSLRATVRAESAHALELLRQEAPDLARTLEQAGVRADAQSLRFENRGGGGQEHHAQQQHRQPGHHHLAAEEEANHAAPIWRTISGDGRVDLLA
ncbi:MAG: flagellar hook-length control protein FliK [Sphingomonas bacterium]